MSKTLSTMTWEEVKAEMSIAGSPEKITEMGKKVLELIMQTVDRSSIAEFVNAQLALERVMAELRTLERRERKRQTPKG